MDQIGPARTESLVDRIPHHKWRTGLLLLIGVGAVLLVAVPIANLQKPTITLSLVIGFAVSIGAFFFAVTRLSRHLHRQQRATSKCPKDQRRRVSPDGGQYPGNLLDDRSQEQE